MPTRVKLQQFQSWKIKIDKFTQSTWKGSLSSPLTFGKKANKPRFSNASKYLFLVWSKLLQFSKLNWHICYKKQSLMCLIKPMLQILLMQYNYNHCPIDATMPLTVTKWCTESRLCTRFLCVLEILPPPDYSCQHLSPQFKSAQPR